MSIAFTQTRKSIVLMILGLIAFILYLLFFGDFPGFLTLLSTLNFTNYAIFYSLAILCVVMAVFFDSLIWHSLLDALKINIKFRRIMLYNWIGNFVEMILPCQTVCGEATRIYLAQREPENDAGISSATVITSRLISTLVYTGGLIVGFIALLINGWVTSYLVLLVTLVTVGTASVVAIILYIALKEGAAERLVDILMTIIRFIIKKPSWLEKEKENLQKTLLSFSLSFKTYRTHPKLLLKPLFFAIIAWTFSLLVFLMVFYALGYPEISIFSLATVFSVTSTVETLTAGFPVGAVEITMVNMFSLYGVPLATAAAATTLTRLITFWCQVLIGYPLINIAGLKASVAKSVQNTEPPLPSPEI
jgi:uncharacterized protein (TIRG00374 family)